MEMLWKKRNRPEDQGQGQGVLEDDAGVDHQEQGQSKG